MSSEKPQAASGADRNREYYSEKGEGIYSDFSTFAQGSALARCNAIEFARNFSGRGGEISVCEYGVGNGNFAKAFLDEIAKESPGLYSRTRYALFDFSGKMLARARKSLSAHSERCSFREFDAASDAPAHAFDYCRINELLTDLPARLFMKKDGQICELFPEPGGSFGLEWGPKVPVLVRDFLARAGEGRIFPFNFGAMGFLAGLCNAGKTGFAIDAFDYGFYSLDDVESLPGEEWNGLMARDYGGQITFDLNFPLVLSSLLARGFAAKVERQIDYAQRVLGARLEAVELASGGLDYAPSGGEEGARIEEDDGFYHLAIGQGL